MLTCYFQSQSPTLLTMAIKSQHQAAVVTAVLVGSAFLTGVDLFIVNVAFDDIGRDFATAGNAPSLSQLSWVLNAYAVLFAALLVPMGRLTDRYGRKNGFVTGMAVFTAASALRSCRRDVMPSLENVFRRCHSTVRGLM